MEYATDSAIAAIADFSQDSETQERLRLYLSEIPIGDEYQMLSERDMELGGRFEVFCSGRGIKVFYEITCQNENPILPD